MSPLMAAEKNSTTMTRLTEQDITKGEVETLVSPSNPSSQTIYLSNIDQLFAFPVETVFFYNLSGERLRRRWSGEKVADHVRRAVSEELLVRYYFMAGRLAVNEKTKRLELICNNSGVLFADAASRLKIDDLGDLSQPNPSFERLVLKVNSDNVQETPLFTIQVTSFICGGFSVGFSVNHSVLDGKAMLKMFTTLAAISRNQDFKNYDNNNKVFLRDKNAINGDNKEDGDNIIYLDRFCLKPRDPPQINYDHDEYITAEELRSRVIATSFTNADSSLPPSTAEKSLLVWKTFSFGSKVIERLKEKAEITCSTFEAVVSHVWRARTVAVFADDLEKVSTVFFSVDIRSRMSPPLPAGFAGNAVMGARARARAAELIEKPFSDVVDWVQRAVRRVDDDYSRSVIDFLEVHGGVPAIGGDGFVVTAWWKLPFYDVDFGCGRPIWSGPAVVSGGEFVLLLANPNDDGVNVMIALTKDCMERFSSNVNVF